VLRAPTNAPPSHSQQHTVLCRITVGAIDAAASGPFKKQAHGHGRENEKSLLCIFVVIALVGTISGKSLKLLPPDVIHAPNSNSGVVVLRHTRHRIGHFGDVSPSQSLGLVWKKTKPNTAKARIHQLKEMYYNTK